MMDNTPSRDKERAPLTTADLAAAARREQHAGAREEPRSERRDDAPPRGDLSQPSAPQRPAVQPGDGREPRGSADAELAALFTPEHAQEFRSRWDAVQIAFVDDPAKAVRDADELVAQVMKSLADSFASERARFEGETQQAGNAATESHRVALRRYRSFFQRLLSL